MTWGDLRLSPWPSGSSKEPGFRRVHRYPWSSSRVLDPLKLNRSKLGLIYENLAPIPWTVHTVSSCVHEFWAWLYFVLSTLSRSTSWPACVREGGGREGFSCPGAAFAASLFYMTEAIWQLHYLFLLFFTPDLASAQDWKTHAQTERLWTSITFVSTRLKSVSWRLNEVSAANPSLWNIRDPFCTSLCDDNHRPVTLEFHMLLLIVDMCIFNVTGLFTILNNVPGLHMHTFTMCALLFTFNFEPLVSWKTYRFFLCSK